MDGKRSFANFGLPFMMLVCGGFYGLFSLKEYEYSSNAHTFKDTRFYTKEKKLCSLEDDIEKMMSEIQAKQDYEMVPVHNKK